MDGYCDIFQHDWSIFNFQRCSHIPQQLILDSNPYETRLEEYVSISLNRSKRKRTCLDFPTEIRLLLRISKADTVELVSVNSISCDMRVRELVLSEGLKNFVSEYLPEIDEVDACIALVLKDVLRDFWEWQDIFNLKLPEQKPEFEAPLRILKCGVVRRMTVTLIYKDLCKSVREGSHEYSEGFMRDLVRHCLKIYSIHVRANTLIDIRECPFLSGTSNKLEFIFIHECSMTKGDAEIGRMSNQTDISIRRCHEVDYFLRIFLILNDSNNEMSLPGLEYAYLHLRSLFETPVLPDAMIQRKHFYSGILLGGAPGSGKKFLVRKVSKRYAAKLLVCNIGFEEKSARLDPESIASKLTRIFEEAERNTTLGYPAVILLENSDVLYVKDTGSGSSSMRNKQAVVNHIASLIDEAGTNKSTCAPFVLVMVTSKPYLIPDTLRVCSRLQQEIFIKVPDLSERIKILTSLQKENPALHSIDMESVGMQTPGYVVADMIRLLHLAILRSQETEEPEVNAEHIKLALRRVPPSVLQGSMGLVASKQCDPLEQISGLDSVKMDLIKTIVWPLTSPQAFRRIGIEPPRGIILYGPSGCGKTSLVRAVASSHHTNFLSVSAAELFCSEVGESEKIIAHLFHRARLASPCVLFVDELDAVVGSRDGKSVSGNSVNEAILSMLLTEMDGIGIRASVSASNQHKESLSFAQRLVVVGATNRPDKIDSALLRPGRFDRLVPVPPPNEADRLILLQNSTKKTPLADDVNLEYIASKTERFSGADIINLCREAGLFALSEDMNINLVSMKHYERALAQASPSISLQYLQSFWEYASRGFRETHDLTEAIKSLGLT